MKKHVATDVATPKHHQDTQEYLVYNHKQEKSNKTQGEHGENLLVRLPPSEHINNIKARKNIVTRLTALLTA